MKLVRRNFEKNGTGSITLIPEEVEDMWHAYNLILEGDQLRSSTIRKVTTESSTGSTSSQRIHTTLTITIESIEFDTHAGALHVKGRNIEENQHVKLGAYHTLDLELQRKFTLSKQHWDAIHLDRIEEACNPVNRADVAAVVMQEGIAHVCLITSNMTLVKAKIDVAIPRKRKGFCSQHDKGITRFYDNVIAAIVRHVNFDIVRCVIIASPGFVKEQFLEYMFSQQATKSPADTKLLTENRSKFLLVHASSGFKHSLNEALADPSVVAKLANTKAQSEVRAMEDFYTMLNTEPARAYYGVRHVERAVADQAVETLLITDALFRSKDLATRRRYVELVEAVRDQSGTVRIFSSLHVTGEQLGLLSGVAAILRFPIPEIEDLDTDDEDVDDDDNNELEIAENPNHGRTDGGLGMGAEGRVVMQVG